MPKISDASPAVVPLADDDQIPVVQETTGAAPIQPKLRRMSWSVLRQQIQPYIDTVVNATFIGTQTYANDRAIAAETAANAYTNTVAASLTGTLAPKANPTLTGSATVAGDLSVAGNLIVAGTTTTTTTTTLAVDDPIMTLGGEDPPTVNDGKDRGVEMRWHDGGAPRLAFIGFKRSTGRFTVIPQAVNTGEVVTGAVGTIEANLIGNVIGNVAGTASNISGTVAIGNGGTGASTASAARTNLGAAPIDSPNFGGAPQINGASIWHANNDGAGSGMDADLLDGQQGSYYLSASNATGTLAVANGGTGATTAAGARANLGVPAVAHTHPIAEISAGGTPSASTFLRGDGTWAGLPGAGTVTSVQVSGGTTGLTTSGGPVTSSGTITLSGTLALANGGTGSTTAAGARTNLGLAAIAASGSAADLTAGTVATARLGSGTASSSTFLRGDGTWAAPAGGGTVTSVQVSGGTTGLTTSGGPVTGSGTITLSGTLAVANGGTGATSAANARTNLGAAPTASPTFTGRVRVGETALTDATLIATDMSAANVFTVTLAGNRTLSNPTNMAAGSHVMWRIRQDATGNRTLVYGTAFKFPGGVVPTLSTTPNALDILTGVSDGTNVYCNLLKDLR